jgi:GT2 family glycosyltransferase
MTRTPSASIVVVNLNGRRHLAALLAHLAVQSVRDFELIFVDNGSHDDSLALVTQSCRSYGIDLHLVRNTHNTGFAPACNHGATVAAAPWVIMLNNDTRPEPRWLEQLLSAAATAPEVGMVASKMLRAHRPDTIDSAGIAVDWAAIAWDWRAGDADDPAESTLQEIFGPCGGAALYSRRMLAEVGSFDADFFAYLEDVDLAWRGRLAGWRCLLQPQARVLHAHSSTLGDASPLKRYLLARNKVWLVAKDYPNPWFARYWPAVAGYDLLATGYGVMTRGDFASLRGRLAGLAGLRPFLARRKSIQRKIADPANWEPFIAPLVPPWAVPRRYAHLKQ